MSYYRLGQTKLDCPIVMCKPSPAEGASCGMGKVWARDPNFKAPECPDCSTGLICKEASILDTSSPPLINPDLLKEPKGQGRELVSCPESKLKLWHLIMRPRKEDKFIIAGLILLCGYLYLSR